MIESDFCLEYTNLCHKLYKDDISKEIVKENNNIMNKLLKMKKKAFKDIEFFKNVYSVLLMDENENVRLLASAHCLEMGVHIKLAKKILKEIKQKSKSNFNSFDAKMLLEQFK